MTDPKPTHEEIIGRLEAGVELACPRCRAPMVREQKQTPTLNHYYVYECGMYYVPDAGEGFDDFDENETAATSECHKRSAQRANADIAALLEEVERKDAVLKTCGSVLSRYHGDHEEGDCPADIQQAFDELAAIGGK